MADRTAAASPTLISQIRLDFLFVCGLLPGESIMITVGHDQLDVCDRAGRHLRGRAGAYRGDESLGESIRHCGSRCTLFPLNPGDSAAAA